MSEWRNVVTAGVLFVVFMELFEIGKWVFTDGWSGLLRFHFRLDRSSLLHCIGLVYSATGFGILFAFGWRAFQGAPLVVLVILVAPLVVAIPFRQSLRNYFRDNVASLPVKAHELLFLH